MENKSYLSIGSNVGNREKNLKEAIILLEKNPEIRMDKISSIYETDPVGYTDQPQFLNISVGIWTSLSPSDLLNSLQEVENELGRKREIRWGPRTIDLDILLYNRENIETEQLIIPHPRMKERGFVMIPLFEIYPDLIEQFNINECVDKEGVRLWKQNFGEDV